MEKNIQYTAAVCGALVAIVGFGSAPFDFATALDTQVIEFTAATLKEQPAVSPRREAPSPVHRSAPLPVQVKERIQTTPEIRIAQRLHSRLVKHGMPTPSLDELAGAVLQRQALFKMSTQIGVQVDGTGSFVWNVSPQAYPLWIIPQFTEKSAGFAISPDGIRDTLINHGFADYPQPVDISLLSVEEEDGIQRVVTTGVAKDGYRFDLEASVPEVLVGLTNHEPVHLDLKHVPGSIMNETGQNYGQLTLLGAGRSNFAGSIPSRKKNIQYALTDHVNNVLVAPDSLYSFNSTLKGPVSQSNGWHMAYVIFNGKDLELAPGGGICQASTTVFRAVANAGFTSISRKAHSMFVHYYEEYGVGMDATIFPGKQDLTFQNDTEIIFLCSRTLTEMMHM